MIPWLIAAVVRALAWTWRVERPAWPVEGPCVVAIWHGDQLAMLGTHRDRGMTGIVSRSKDGSLLAAVLAHLGVPVLRGSTSRGGAEVLLAARALLRSGGRPVFAVDGPRGPAGVVQPGAEALAARARLPIVWGVVEARPAWRARSWDSFAVPLPFARITIRYGVWRPGGARLQEELAPPAGSARRVSQ